MLLRNKNKLFLKTNAGNSMDNIHNNQTITIGILHGNSLNVKYNIIVIVYCSTI